MQWFNSVNEKFVLHQWHGRMFYNWRKSFQSAGTKKLKRQILIPLEAALGTRADKREKYFGAGEKKTASRLRPRRFVIEQNDDKNSYYT